MYAIRSYYAKTARWINEFQSVSSLPLLVAIDGEWGPAMRIDSTIRYPYNQALGAVQDTNLIYQMGKEFGEQLKMLGVNMNFAPDADINTNPANPVINFRSFGEDKQNVALKAWMVAKGIVITSYSIHYTKLYDPKFNGSRF